LRGPTSDEGIAVVPFFAATPFAANAPRTCRAIAPNLKTSAMSHWHSP
jgi:hypothetical protein